MPEGIAAFLHEAIYIGLCLRFIKGAVQVGLSDENAGGNAHRNEKKYGSEERLVAEELEHDRLEKAKKYTCFWTI